MQVAKSNKNIQNNKRIYKLRKTENITVTDAKEMGNRHCKKCFENASLMVCVMPFYFSNKNVLFVQRVLCAPRIVAFIALVSCSKLQMIFLLFIKQSILSASV
jgi:hypothetical protein